uniref:F-box domain-containing protein n=1 Tax=Brassica campestris TaxID=3711 RepID=A0A3P5Y8E3_BRACM|nr:unnamed protein product [Brassica rapa]
MTKIFDLPTNLVEEILSKIPFKYMREVRLTCKQWDTLSKNDATKVIVWNPYWGQTRSIECRCPSYGYNMFSYALGYEDKGSCRSYKFLRFIDRYVDYATRDEFLCKFLRVLEPDLAPLITCNGFFVEEENKVAMGFVTDLSITTFNIVGEAGYLKKLKLVECLEIDIQCARGANACSYVPSLVQIKQPASGTKRKEQSDLEKQRCDQNMSRLVAFKKRSKFW